MALPLELKTGHLIRAEKRKEKQKIFNSDGERN